MHLWGCLCLSFFLAHLSHVTHAQTFNLTLLVTRDIKGELTPVDDDDSPCAVSVVENDGSKCEGGTARMKTYIEHIKATEPNVLVLDHGVYYFGSLFYAVNNGNLSADTFARVGYNGSMFGSRDFSLRSADLARYIQRRGQGPIMTNVDVSTDTHLSGLFKKYQVYTFGSRKVAVFGLLDVDVTSSSNAGGTVRSNFNGLTAKQHLLSSIDDMQKAHPTCNIVVVLIRSNSADELQRAQSILSDVKGVDILIRAPQDLVTYDFPEQVVTNIYNEQALMTTSRTGKYVSHYRMMFDANGNLVNNSWSGGVVKMLNSTAQNPGLWNGLLRPKALEIESFANISVGTLTTTADFSDCRTRECGLGRLVGQAALAACPLCDMVLFNAGMLRASLVAGSVSRTSIIRSLPFGNSLYLVTLTGSQLLDVLQHGADNSISNGRFLQGGGFQWAVNANTGVPNNQRILEINVRVDRANPSIASSNLRRWSPSDTFTVAVTDFIRGGGDSYPHVATAPTVLADGPLFTTLVTDYLAANSPYNGPTSADLDACETFPLPITASGCTIVKSSLAFNILEICSGSAAQCRTADPSYSQRFFGESSLVNRSECDVCSGLGTCDGVFCRCRTPTVGLFKGIAVARGTDCSDLRTEEVVSTSWKAIIFVVTGLSTVVCLGASAVYFIYRKHRIIRSSSPEFLQAINLGGLFCCASVILMFEPPNEISCMTRVWFLLVGFVLTFGSLFLKTFRIAYIFNNTKLTSDLKLTTSRLLTYLGAMVAMESLVMIFFHIISPYGEVIEVASNTSWTYFATCGSDHGEVFVLILTVGNVILIAAAGVYAYKARNVAENFNESRFLFAAIQNIALVIFLLLVTLLAELIADLNSRLVLTAVVINFLVLSTHGILFVSKISAMRHDSRSPEHKRSSIGNVPMRLYENVRDKLHRLRDRERKMKAVIRELSGDPEYDFNQLGVEVSSTHMSSGLALSGAGTIEEVDEEDSDHEDTKSTQSASTQMALMRHSQV